MQTDTPAVAGPVERQVRPLALCALCGADKGYTLGVGDTYRWWTVCCGACGRQVDECRSDGNTSMNASKPLSWPAADEVWSEAGAHAEELRANRDRAVRLLHLAMAQLRKIELAQRDAGERAVIAWVRVTCPDCGWTGRRREEEAHWWRNREVPTCPKCAYHPVRYGRPNVRANLDPTAP